MYKLFKGKFPPFEKACEDHDEAYLQVVTKGDKSNADLDFYGEVYRTGYIKTANFFNWAVTNFGWVAIFKRNLLGRRPK